MGSSHRVKSFQQWSAAATIKAVPGRAGHRFDPPGLGDPQGVAQALGETKAGETHLPVRRGRVVQHLAGRAEHVGAGGELDGLQVVGETGEVAPLSSVTR
ncbi:hypothetical protein AB0I06_18825 [Streptomyces sp. NPDC050674]|uniref:hypothetical protein n=1 Tax=Streptomyces sp. NPDC050674 TaxID=3157216 RepID=UPI003441B3B3